MKNNQSGGYDYEFVHTPADNLICKICHCPSKEPHLSACCGHTFCKSCLEAASCSTTVNNACPMCRSEEFTTIPNKQVDRTIRCLTIYCSNKKKGCQWQGEVNTITSHLNSRDGCQFQDVSCPNDCGVAYQRQKLTNHIEIECPRRKINCRYCHDKVEHRFIESQHKDECPKLPLPCPNKCEVETIPRDGVEEHIKICPLQQIQCKYYIVGCEATITRKDQEKHNKEMMEEHLSLCVHKLVIVVEKNDKGTQQLSAKENDAQTLVDDLTQEHATTEKQVVSLTNDNSDKAVVEDSMKFQSEQDATEMKAVVRQATVIKENFSQQSMTHQVQAAASQQQLSTSKNKLQQNINVLIILLLGLVGLNLALMYSLYVQHNNISGLEKYQDEMKTWITSDLLLKLQRLEKDHNTTKLHVENKIVKLVGSVNNTALTGFNDLTAQLPFLLCFSGYIEYRKELIIKEEKSLLKLPGKRCSPLIVKISGISSVVKTGHIFYKESTLIYIKQNTVKLLVWKFNNTHLEVMLYKQPATYKNRLWLEKFIVTIKNKINDSDHYTLDLHDRFRYTFEKTRMIQPAYSFSQFVSLDDIFAITPNCQFVMCDSVFFSIDHPDFYRDDVWVSKDLFNGEEDYAE